MTDVAEGIAGVVSEEISGQLEIAHESSAVSSTAPVTLTVVKRCRVFVPDAKTGREHVAEALDSGRRKPMFAHYEGHSTGWTLALVHVDGELAPRWIAAERVDPSADELERWTR
jgi:hypothetical protein